jgi:hypothetical protein
MEKKVSKNKVKSSTNKRKEKIYYATTEQKDVRSFLVVILVVLCCVGLIYLATRAFVTKDLFEKDDKEEVVTPVSVNYDKAIVGNMLGKPEKEYYVVVYDMTGDYMADMSSLVSGYNAKEKHLHIYTVDLSNKLNADYYDTENENVKATSVEDFKFGDITLIKVTDGKVKSYITDYTKMKKELGV